MKLPIEYIENRKKYILFKNDCGVSDMTRRGGIYEHYIFDYIRNNIDVKGKTIIDVGANFGFHTLEFADLVVDAGNLVNVPVKVKSPDHDLSALQLDIKYDSDLLEFKNVVNSEKVMNWLSYFNPDNNLVSWGGADFSNENMLKNNEVAFTLQFTALEPKLNWTVSPLYVAEKYVGDELAKDMNITPTHGRIEVRKRNFNGEMLDGFAILTYPNPTDNFTNIQFNLPEDSDVEVALFDITGRKLIQVINERMPAGQYSYEVDLTVLSGGVYYTSILTKDQVATSKTVIIK